MSEIEACGVLTTASGLTGLRISSVFVIWAGGTFGALFPIVAHRKGWLKIPVTVWEFAKYFGSGVIIATAFIHLLSPALDELSSPCLSPAWQDYPYALALAMLGIFALFIVEIIAFRWGSAKLAAIGISHNPHSRALDDPAADVPETDFSRLHGSSPETPPETSRSFPSGLLDVEKDGRVDGSSTNGEHSNIETAPLAQLVGIAILEFGVLLHSVLIGMTLAVTDDDHFRVLFVVLIIHQVFEGLGLGSRFAITKLPGKFGVRAPPLAAFLYGIATPIGIAAGLGLRNSYTPNGPTASIVSGVLDSLSAGILIYTSLVELLAHEFLFNPEMINASNTKITFAIGSMLAGCGIMALLGRWA